MLNQIVLVGRLVRDPQLKTGEKNKQYMYISLAIPRSFKNINGEYETDFVDCLLWDGVAKSTSEYCKKGDIVGKAGVYYNGTHIKDIDVVVNEKVILSLVDWTKDNKKFTMFIITILALLIIAIYIIIKIIF